MHWSYKWTNNWYNNALSPVVCLKWLLDQGKQLKGINVMIKNFNLSLTNGIYTKKSSPIYEVFSFKNPQILFYFLRYEKTSTWLVAMVKVRGRGTLTIKPHRPCKARSIHIFLLKWVFQNFIQCLLDSLPGKKKY